MNTALMVTTMHKVSHGYCSMSIINTLLFSVRHLSWGRRGRAVASVLASDQCVLGLIPGDDVICRFILLLVLIPAPRVFLPGSPLFLHPQKQTFPVPRVICRLSLLLVLCLLQEVFLRVLQYSALLKNQHSEFSIQSGIRGSQVCQL